MEKHIVEENGLSYTLGEDGLYYLDLVLPENTNCMVECVRSTSRSIERRIMRT